MKKMVLRCIEMQTVLAKFCRSCAAIVAPQVLPTFPKRKVGRTEGYSIN